MKTFQFTPQQIQEALKDNNYNFWMKPESIEAQIIKAATEAGYVRRVSHTQAEWTEAGAKWAKEFNNN